MANALDLLLAQLGQGGVDLTPSPQRDDWTQYRRQPWGMPPTANVSDWPAAARQAVPTGGGVMNPNYMPSTERGGLGLPVELSGGMAWDRNRGQREPLGLQGTVRMPLPFPGDPLLELSGGYQLPGGPGQRPPWNVRAGVKIPF